MATAEELLVAGETSDNKVLIIDSDLRTIAIPSDFGVFGVESDDDVLRVYFRGPRFYHDVDLSTFDVRVNIENASGERDLYMVTDLVAEDNAVTFSWLVGRFVAKTEGAIRFSLCFIEADDSGVVHREFNTAPATGKILHGLEAKKAIEFEYPEIIEQLMAKLEYLESIEWHATKTVTKGTSVLEEQRWTFSGDLFLSTKQAQFNANAGVNYDVYWNGEIYNCTARLYDDEIYLGNGSLVHGSKVANTGEPFCFYAILSAERITVLKKATSGTETITVKVDTAGGIEYNKLPKEFLPDDIPTGGGVDVVAEVGQTILVEEVDSAGKPTKWKAVDYQPRTHYEVIKEVVHVPETTGLFGLTEDGNVSHVAPAPGEVIENGTYTVIFDGSTYKCQMTRQTVDFGDGDPTYIFTVGNFKLLADLFEQMGMPGIPAEDTGESFCCLISYSTESRAYLWSVITLDEVIHTISITGPAKILQKLPSKYVDVNVVEEFRKENAVPGHICMLNIAGQMEDPAEDKPIHGLCIKEVDRLGVPYVEVQVAGYITVSYTGPTPPCGYVKLTSNGQGGVKINTSGREYFVTKFDNLNGTVEIRL